MKPLTAALIAVQQNAELLRGAPGQDGKDGQDGLEGKATTGLIWRGTFAYGTTYQPGDVVEWEGSSYVALVVTARRPPDPEWDLLAAKGEPGASGRGYIRGGGGSSSSGSALAVKDEGVSLDAAVTSIDFAGAGVTATAVGNAVTVTIPGGSSGDFIPQGGPLTQDLDAGGFTLKNLAAPVAGNDPVRLTDMMGLGLATILTTSNNAGGNPITFLADPTDPQDAATKASSEAAAATRAPADAAYYVTTASGGLSAEVVVPAFVQTLLDDANAATARTTLGLGTAATTAATDYQPIDSDLTAIAALTTTAFGRALLVLADPADATKFLNGAGAFSVPPDVGLTQPQVMARSLGC